MAKATASHTESAHTDLCSNIDPMPYNDYPDERPPERGCPLTTRPEVLWAQTWGMLGAQHIRSLRIRPLGGLVLISMTGEADPVSVVQEAFSSTRISTSEIDAAASKAFDPPFDPPFEGAAAAWKLNRFFYEIGIALRAARVQHRNKNHARIRYASIIE